MATAEPKESEAVSAVSFTLIESPVVINFILSSRYLVFGFFLRT